MSKTRNGLVVGAYAVGKAKFRLTNFGECLNHYVKRNLNKELSLGGPIERGQVRLYWGLTDSYNVVAVVGLGDENSWSQNDQINGLKEGSRNAASSGAKALQEQRILTVDIEDFGCAQSAAEGARLGTFVYQDLRNPTNQLLIPKLKLADKTADARPFAKGLLLANSQNFTRKLLATPSNKLTKHSFYTEMSNRLTSSGVIVVPLNSVWLAMKSMNAFLTVTRNVHEVLLIKLYYEGISNTMRPIVIVGKGNTFDSDGRNLKYLDDPNITDMGSAANVVGVMSALAVLKVPLNIIGLLPMCDNMPTKPGDLMHEACEGRTVLNATLSYGAEQNPLYIINLATMSPQTRAALGNCAAVLTNSEKMWKYIHKAGIETGDRVSDLRTLKPVVESCTAAAFSQDIVPHDVIWVHVDMLNVMGSSTQPYHVSEMSGRHVRTIIEFILLVEGLSDFHQQ